MGADDEGFDGEDDIDNWGERRGAEGGANCRFVDIRGEVLGDFEIAVKQRKAIMGAINGTIMGKSEQ